MPSPSIASPSDIGSDRSYNSRLRGSMAVNIANVSVCDNWGWICYIVAMTLTKDEFTSIAREYYPDIDIEEIADGLIIRPNLLMDIMVIGEFAVAWHNNGIVKHAYFMVEARDESELRRWLKAGSDTLAICRAVGT